MRRVTTVLVALAAPATAWAQSPSASPPALTRSDFLATMDADYRAIDANHDGAVTATELQAFERKRRQAAAAERARAAFRALDKNRDGQLNLAEFSGGDTAEMAPVDVSQAMRQFDSDRSGTVTLIEYRRLTLENFDRFDLDQDGVISAAEQQQRSKSK